MRIKATGRSKRWTRSISQFALEDQRFENQCSFEQFEKKRIKKAKIAAERAEKVAQMTAERIEMMEKLDALTAQLQAESQEAGGTA